MKDARIVILGNGGAAVHAARAARASGHGGEIHMVSDAETPAFNPMLSPYFLKGMIPWEHCFPFGQRFYGEHDIHLHMNAPAESLDTINQQVTLRTGEVLSYDRCLIATGADPMIPPVPGLRGSPHSLRLRTAASARNLEAAILSAKKVLVLGASLVGLKVAEILRKRRVQVILSDVADQMLPRGAHASSASILRTYFEEQGVDVRLGCTLEGTEDTRRGAACHFAGGIVEEVDFVAVCTGVRPNLQFMESEGVETRQAILVGPRMRTSRQNLYAAGDVSQGYDLLSGKQEWLGTWGNACMQGRVAGYNMAGRDVAHPGAIPQNISPFFGWTYAQLGDVKAQTRDARTLTFGDPKGEGYFVLTFAGDVLIGVNLINCTHLAGKLRTAITRKWHWGQSAGDIDESSARHLVERISDRNLTTLSARFRNTDSTAGRRMRGNSRPVSKSTSRSGLFHSLPFQAQDWRTPLRAIIVP